MRKLLEEARRMIGMNSVTAHGNEEIANFAVSLMKERGLKVQLQDVMHSSEEISKRQMNAIGILGDALVDRKTRKGLLLHAHLDTANPGIQKHWTETQGAPFTAVIQEGRIFGLGAADAKLDFLCKLHAIERFRERKLRMPVYLVGSAGGELGMFGVRYLIQSKVLNPRYVVVGDPTELKIAYTHKGQHIFRISLGYPLVERDAKGFNRRVRLQSLGRSAHGAYPRLGRNAIEQMLSFLRNIEAGGFDLRLTRIFGGGAGHQVPDTASAEFYLTSHQYEDFKIFFRNAMSSAGTEFPHQIELGGLGDMGVRFLPETTFSCLSEVWKFFGQLAVEFEGQRDVSYNPPFSTVNFCRLEQQLSGLELLFDLHLLPEAPPGAPVEEIEKQIQKGVRAIASRHTDLNISVVKSSSTPPLKMTLDHEWVRICQNTMDAAGLQGGFQKKSVSTEAAQYFQAGYDVVVFGPGVSHGNSHSPNENNSLDHLEKAVVFYEKLIERVCL